jgi:catalase (peroxidase I)
MLGHRFPTYRGSDMRGGSNGGRICLEPSKIKANNPKEPIKCFALRQLKRF